VKYILGPYMIFESRLRWMKKFYKFKIKTDCCHADHHQALKKNHKLDLKKISILRTYIVNYSSFKNIFKKCLKGGKHQEIMEVVDKGMD